MLARGAELRARRSNSCGLIPVCHVCLRRFQGGKIGFCEGGSWAEAPDRCEVALRGGRAWGSVGRAQGTGSRGREAVTGARGVRSPRPPFRLTRRAACTASAGSSPCWSPPASGPTWTRTRQRWSAWAGARRAPRPSGGEARSRPAGCHLPSRALVGSPGERRGGSGGELCGGGGCCRAAPRLRGCLWARTAPCTQLSAPRVFPHGCLLPAVCLRMGEAASFFLGLTEAAEPGRQPPHTCRGGSRPLSSGEGGGGVGGGGCNLRLVTLWGTGSALQAAWILKREHL